MARKKSTGRPTVMTTETVRKLEEAFLLGCTDREACLAADISHESLYSYCRNHPEFTDRKETLKQNPVYKARKLILDAITEQKDVASAHKVIDRKEGSKVAVTGADGGPIQVDTPWQLGAVKVVERVG